MKAQLDSILEKWNLLKHPFYESWTAGTLSVDALKVYASEYGAFINTLADGWTTLNDEETANEEREHAELWAEFASALGTTIGTPKIAQSQTLIEEAQTLFSDRASALGAMYAFEAQQPETAKSKLIGLKKYYSLPASVEPYFEVHSRNWHESEKILKALSALTPEEQTQALAACERMSEALWNALTGIHEKTCMN